MTDDNFISDATEELAQRLALTIRLAGFEVNNYSLREALEGVPSGDNPIGYLQHCVHNALLRERAGDLSRNQQRQLDQVLRFWTGGYQSLGLQRHLASGLYRLLTQAIHEGAEDYCF